MPSIRDEVDGIEIFRRDFVSSLLYSIFKSFKFIYLGKYKYIIMHEDVSVTMFNNINIDIWIDNE